MFCLHYREHNTKSKFSKSMTFNIEPCVRYKKNAINDIINIIDK